MKISKVFPTDIGQFDFENFEELNRGLVEFIYDLRGQEAEKKDIYQYSMGGSTGYHTSGDILKSENEYIKEFHKLISNPIKAYYNMVFGENLTETQSELFAWGMIYGRGDYSIPHNHGKSKISTAYYIKVPPDMVNNENISPGTLYFSDPRSAVKTHVSDSNRYILAKEGQAIIFPGWLEHFVTPHDVDGYRICITTNLNIFDLQ